MAMTKERKAELYNNAMDWVFDHTENLGYYEYIGALKNIGLTRAEAEEELSYCHIYEDDRKDVEEGLDDFYGLTEVM